MVGLWIVLALLGLLGLVLLLPVEFWLRHHQEGMNGRVHYRLRIGPFTMSGGKEVGDTVQKATAGAVETVAASQAKGKTKKGSKGAKKRGVDPTSPLEFLGWALPAVRYFRRRVRIHRLNLFLEVGGLDAFESAMLAGLAWTVAGTFGSMLSHLFPLRPGIYRVTVEPNWQEPALGLTFDCMATFRVGHAIWAGVLLVPRALENDRLAAWWRRRRQKGEDANG